MAVFSFIKLIAAIFVLHLSYIAGCQYLGSRSPSEIMADRILLECFLASRLPQSRENDINISSISKVSEVTTLNATALTSAKEGMPSFTVPN